MYKNLVIIGGGPGGYTAALVAAQKNIKTTLIEKREIGGTCLNRGCIPTKALLASSHMLDKIKCSAAYGINTNIVSVDLPAIINRKNKVVETLRTSVTGLMQKKNIEIINAQAKILSKNKIMAGGTEIPCDAIIIATGSEPMKIWQGENIITSDEALMLEEIPATLLVVGAGAVGLELACFFASLGAKVTVVEMAPRIFPAIDKEITDTLVRELKKKGITLKTACGVEKIENGTVFFTNGKTGVFDKILQAVGRKFNTENIGLENISVSLEKGRIVTDSKMETSEKGVYAIGDVAAKYPLLAHAASAQGITAALNIAGEENFFDGSAIPGCIYTSPEMASVGQREEDVENAITARVPFRVMGRAHAEGEIAGLLKIVADKETHRIKGVHIIGERATDLIQEGVLHLALGATIGELAKIIYAHPTFAECFGEAFHLLEGRGIHVL